MKKTIFSKIITLLIIFGLLLGSLPGEAFALAKASSLPKAQADLNQTSADIMLSGTVYDGGIEGGDKHGYPLYAKITLTADGESQVLYTDPLTGTYAVPIQSAVDYTIRVEALLRGYNVAEESFSATAALVKDFHLTILSTCTAPGYKPDYAYYYDFEGSDEGFTFVKAGDYLSWAWGEFTSGPNHAVSGNKGIATNPHGTYNFGSNGYVVSPIIDLSNVSEEQTAYIEWWEWIRVFSVPDQAPPVYMSIEFSRDGGNNWISIWGERSRRQDESFQKRKIYIDPIFHVPNFQFRFQFKEGNPSLPVLDDGWYIDNIGIAIVEDSLFPVTPLYTYQFDSENEAQWTAIRNRPSIPTSWEQGVPTSGPMQAYSGENVWATNLDGNYVMEEGYIVSPVMDLSGINDKEIVIQYRDWLRTNRPYSIYSKDYGVLEVSNDEGANFSQIGLYKYRDDTIGDPYKLQKVRIKDLSYAIENFQLRFGFFADRSGFDLGWYIDDVSIGYSDPIDVSCMKENGALMTGYVLDQVDPDIKIVDASIESDTANARTLARAEDSEREGLYYFFQPLDGDSGDVDMRISKYRYFDAEETLTLNSGAILNQNFYLASGWLIPESASIERTIFLDDDDEIFSMGLLNQGALDVNWISSKLPLGFDPLTENLTMHQQAEPITILSDLFEGTDLEQDEQAANKKITLKLLSAAAKYGITQAPATISLNRDFYQLWRWESLDDLDTYNILGTTVKYIIDGAFLFDDYSTLYGLNNYSELEGYGGRLYTINTQNAESTFFAQLETPKGAGYFDGFTSADDFFYATATRSSRNEERFLLKVDPFGGVSVIARYQHPESIGNITYVHSEKTLYGTSGDFLVRINPNTGEMTRVGTFQSGRLSYDKARDILYTFKSNWSPCRFMLSVVDRETAETELIAEAEYQERCDFLFLAIESFGDNPVDEVPWLEIGTRRGKTLAGESSTLDLGFKVRDVIEQPGDYHAELTLINDTPRGDITIPITLHVLRPYSWGNFKGTVTGGEQCDLNPVPLPRAEIRFYRDQELVKSIRADENGYFSYALEKGNYDIEIVYPNYVNYRIENIKLGPSEDLVLDIPMRHDSACLSWEPTAPFATQYAGELSLQTLTLRNTGARGTEIVLEEILGEGAFAIDLNLDDGSAENSVSLGGAVPMVWLNRFTPDAESFPFWLESVEVFWPKNTGLELNDRFDIVVYQNKVSNHDPALGGEFLYKQRVSASKLGAFENYVLNEPVLLEGPGDVIIGLISLETPCDPNLPCYWPAAIDMDSSQQRSWLGTWGAEVPEIPTLPPLGFWMVMDDAGLPSNFLVRGYGITADNLQDVPWLTLGQESGFIERDGGTFETELLFDSTGMSWGDYDAQVRVSNAPDPRVYVPVKLRVLPFNMMYLPLIQVFYAE